MEEVKQGVKFDLRGRKLKDQKKDQEPLDQLYNLAEEIPREAPLAQTIKKPEQRMRNLVDDMEYAGDLARLKKAMGEFCARLPHSFGEFTD